MKRFFEWLDNVTFSIAEALVIAGTILFLIFAWDIIKAYRKMKKNYKVRKIKKQIDKLDRPNLFWDEEDEKNKKHL